MSEWGRFPVAAAEQTFIEVSQADNRGEGNENTAAGGLCAPPLGNNRLAACCDSESYHIVADKRLQSVYSAADGQSLLRSCRTADTSCWKSQRTETRRHKVLLKVWRNILIHKMEQRTWHNTATTNSTFSQCSAWWVITLNITEKCCERYVKFWSECKTKVKMERRRRERGQRNVVVSQ